MTCTPESKNLLTETTGNPNKPRLSYEKITRSLAVIGCLGSLALASPANSSKNAIRLDGAGFNTNAVWVTDENEANEAAARVANSGATDIRIILPYSQGSAEVKNDVIRTCNAAKAAYSHDLDLMITMQGYYRLREGKAKDGLGYMPTRAHEKQKYVTAITNLMWSLAGDKNPDGTGGCLPEQKELTIGFFNEPNNKRFNINQYINGRWVAPENTVELMRYAYPRLKQQAAQKGLEVDLTLVGGDISTSRSSNAVGFLRQMGRYMEEQQITEPLMDEFAAHYYLQGVDADPSTSASDSIRLISASVSENFGQVPLIYNELGAYSETPVAKEKLYKEPVPEAILPLKGVEQGLFYKQFILTAVCQGVKKVLIFHETDDKGDKLRTGVNYPDKTSKPGKPIVRKAFIEATAGTTDC
ncbi:MAG: hypothetical protein WD885_01625 [Candidatus Saccharimonadales bacterium]